MRLLFAPSEAWTSMRRSFFAAALLLCAYLGLTLALRRDQETEEQPPRREARPPREPRLLPGTQPSGEVQLPNQWSLRPAGRQIVVGDFPVNIAVHPDGQWLAVLHAGFGDHEIVIMDLKTHKKTSRVLLDQTFVGLCFSPDGKRLFASGGEQEIVHAFDFEEGLLSSHKKIAVAPAKEQFVVAGVAVDRAGKNLFAAGTWGHAVAIVPLEELHKQLKVVKVDVGKESYPYTCLPDASGKRVFVSLWNKAAIGVLDVTDSKLAATWETEPHPTEMALSPNGKTLFVACANSTKVSVLDAQSGKSLQTLAASLYPAAPAGNTPNSLSLTPDGKLLFVANADANNLAVFNVEERGNGRPLGFIPVGWYPTSVRYNATDKRLYVANGKGVSPKANRHGPNPLQRVQAVQTHRGQTIQEYIAALFQGTVSVIEMPNPQRMSEYSKQAYACSPLRADSSVTAERPEGNPIPGKVGEKSPIKYCLYIIKENRTYDQVFGDMPEGNGDASLCLFPDKVTPNHHKLVRQFVLLDNFYVDGEVSADGHQWSMAAYCTDYVEKVWPLTYRAGGLKKLPAYPSEGNVDSIERPAGGYIWDRCAEAKVSY